MNKSFYCLALFFLATILFSVTASGQAENCANSEDLRSWKIVILTNYQSSKPDEKNLAVDAARKFIEKGDRCRIKDQFVPWLKKRLPGWTNGAAFPVSSAYDADLARKLGGNENGMKIYVFCILKTGPKDRDFTGKARDDIFAGHMANISRLADEGKLAVAGPFEKNDKGYRGLYIFNASTIKDAEAIVATDPAVKSGILVPDLTLWYGSASLMATPEIHKKITKQ